MESIQKVNTDNGEIIRTADELSVEDVLAQVKKIQTVMQTVMRKDEHYGLIPGVPKPSLFKPGAEKLCLTFRLGPDYQSSETMDGVHLTVKSKCTLYHIPTGTKIGSGEGSCSTKESKYAYREARRICPKCGKDAIVKGKAEYGGGFICFEKKGGCKAKYKDDDRSITQQPVGRVPNEDIPDQYNTILKMANKRSLVAAVLNATAASDIFTQDVEDLNLKQEAFEAAKPKEKENSNPEPDPFGGVFGEAPKTEAEQTKAEQLADELDKIAKLDDLLALESWGTQRKDEVAKLTDKEQEAFRNVYRKEAKRIKALK